MIKLFSPVHISIILLIVFILVALFLILRNKNIKTQKTVILILLFSNFALHFLKMFFSPYNTSFATYFHKMTFENICAVSTMIAPFIFLFVKDDSPIHDYMFLIMFLGGLLGVLLATEPSRVDCTIHDCVRYFYCHGILFICALLPQMLGIYKVKIKNVWIIPVGFLVYQTIIFTNEVLLFVTKLTGNPCVDSWEVLLDSNLMNNSFTFGPTPDMAGPGKWLLAVTPDFLEYEMNGYHSCFPVIWLIFPTIVYLVPIHLLISLPFFLINRKKKVVND